MTKLNELEESLSILLSLYVMIEQNLEALIYYEKYLSNDSNEFLRYEFPDKEESFVDEAITESLWFQIILKTCSFLDEWDKMLGVNTGIDNKQRIKIIKQVVKPARKAINQWKDLRGFRNEIIAHNFRGKKGVVKLFDIHKYDCPQTTSELYYVVKFLNRMIRIANANLSVESSKVVMSMGKIYNETANSKAKENELDDSKLENLRRTLEIIDEFISNEVFSIVRYDLIAANLKAIEEAKRNE